MAGLLDLFSGRSSDIYGAGLLTPEQRGGLGNIGLLALAGKLGQLAGPSFSPVPDFGAALGQAAGAYGASQEGAGTAALNAILTGQKGRKLEQELEYSKQLGPILAKLAGHWPGADGSAGGGTAGGEDSGSTGGGVAAPLGAGGGGGDAPPIPQSEAVDKARYYARLYGVPEEMFLHQINGENGFKASGVSSAGAQGIAQFIPSTAKQYGVDVSSVDSSLDGAARYMRDLYQKTGSWDGALRRYLGATSDESVQKVVATNKPYAAAFAAARAGGGAAPTAAAPDSVRVPYNYGAPSGGLLTPNPLSDAEPMLPVVRAQRAATAGTAAPVSAPGASPEDTANQILRGWTAGSGGGGPLAAPLAAGTDPIMSVTSADQAGGGEAPAAAPPRAPLPVMGPAGIELPPMSGPLAAPAPAAAAPAAPGAGLLAPPGMPAAALPRVNPAYDAYLRNLAVAGALSEGAGLKNVFGPLTDALKASPAFQAQLEIARKTAGLPFVAAETTAKKAAEEPFDIRASERALGNSLTEKGWRLGPDGQAVRIPGYDAMTEATALATARGTAEGGFPTTLIIKSVENQNKIIADAAANGNQVTFDKDGKMTVSRLSGADAAAQAAAAATARGTGSIEPATALRQGPGGPYEAPTTKTRLADELNAGPAGTGPVAAPGPNAPIGGLVGKPVYTPGQITAQEAAATNNEKLIQTYRETADAAASAKTTLLNISGDIGNMVHGPFAPAAQSAATYLRLIDPSFNRQVSSYEDLYSNANELVRKAVKQSDPNPSFVQTQMAFQSLPVPEKSPEGLRIITNRMIGVNDHDTARAAAIPVYAQEHGGSNAGFDAWWRGNASPYAFVFMRMAPQDQQALVAKLNVNPQGQREIAKLKQQIAFINKNGLEQ